MILLIGLSFIFWIWLFFLHGRFWQRGPILYPISPDQKESHVVWPDIHIIIPARDEAEGIENTLLSLINQEYPGYFDITLVDDESTDGTGQIALKCKNALPETLQHKLQIIRSAPRPDNGWSGKLWALSQGIQYIEQCHNVANAYFLFTDADITHDPLHLMTLVNKSLNDHLDQVSEMVELRCQNWFEKTFIPAFVYFFCMLYPFSKVNNTKSVVAAGAGGTVLLRQEALKRIGGIEALKTALIDDVTLATLVKKNGGKIYLGHSCLARSMREYNVLSDIWNMITRTAYVQLHYSLMMLGSTIILMSLIWFVPFIGILTTVGFVQKIAFVTYLISIVSFIPTLSRFRLSLFWIFTLPFVALFYLMATIGSAINYYRGKGMAWKGRAYNVSAIGRYKKDLQITLNNLTPNLSINDNLEQQGEMYETDRK